MTTVPPSSSPLPQMLAAASTAPPVATVTAPPAALAALQAGATVEGIATPTPDPRVTLLATPAGDVALRTPQPVPLPDGAKLTVEIVRATREQLTVRFTAVDGQPIAQTAAPRPAPGPIATVIDPAPALAATPLGTKITGTIERGPDPRVPLLVTPKGDIPLRTATPLPDGATLEVEVARTTPQQVTVRLIALNGQPIQQSTAQPPPAQTPPVTAAPPAGAPGTPPPIPTGQAWWPGGAQPLTALPTISAFVLSAPPVPEGVIPTGVTIPTPLSAASASPAPGAPSAATPPANAVPAAAPSAVPVGAPPPATPATTVFSAGADLALKITAITLPAAATPPTAPTPAVAAATGQPIVIDAVPTASTNAMPAAPSVATPPAIQAVPVPPVSVDSAEPAPGLQLPRGTAWPPDAPQPPASVQPAAPAAIVTGTIIRIADGVPVVRIGEADVQLNIRANLPVGTTVTMEVRAQQPATLPLPAPVPPTALVPLSPAQPGWPTLTEAVQLLQRLDPQAAQQLMNAIPDGGSRTAVAMMSFAQALRTGEARQWPGDNTLRALERTGPRGAHLAGQLAAEVADLGRQARDVGSEWRALPMPWHADGKIERIRLMMCETDPDAEAEKRKRGGGTRFVIELDLSRLGPLQVDGMFKKETRSFDLMIRTKAPLPVEMQRDLTGIFANSNAAMNLVGALTFQVVKKFPDPTAASANQDKTGLWV